MNTTNCSHCGQPIAANQNFCPFCGQAAVKASTAHAQTATAVSASLSLLMLFFAQNFTPAAGMLGAGAVVPCHPNVKVNAHELVKQMMAAAFWSLRQRQFISIATGKKEGWIFKTTPVNVRLLQHASLSGLEHDFLETMRIRQTASTVEEIIVDFITEDMPDPSRMMLDRAVEWAIHLGYGQAEQKRGIFKPSELNFAPECQFINSLDGAARAFQTEWQQFQTQEAELFNELVRDCKDAISRRTEVATNDNTYDND